MSNLSTLADLFNHSIPGSKTAVILPEAGTRVSYDSLRDQVMTMASALRALGINRGDRVATVLPNGLPANYYLSVDSILSVENGQDVKAGDIIVISAVTPHCFVNSGDTPLRRTDIHASPKFVTEWLDENSRQKNAKSN